MLASRKVIGMKTETVQGTPVSLSQTDFFHAWDVEIIPDGEMLPRNYSSSSLDKFSDLIGKKWTPVKFKRHLHGGGSAGAVLGPISALLQASGLTEAVSAGVSVTYSPSSTPPASFLGLGKSSTIKLYEDGSVSDASSLLTTVAGAVGDLTMSIEAGKPVEMAFDGKGVYAAVADAAIPTNTPSSIDPPIVKSASFSIGGYSAIIQKLEIKLGNDVGEIMDVNSANCILGFQIGERDVTGSMDPNAVQVAAHDFYGKFMAGTLGALTITIGSGAGYIWTLTAPKVQYQRPTKITRASNMLALQVPLKFTRNSGDDCFSFVAT